MFKSLNEASCCTDYKAKNLNSLLCTIAEKITKNYTKNTIFQQENAGFAVFLDFLSKGTLQKG